MIKITFYITLPTVDSMSELDKTQLSTLGAWMDGGTIKRFFFSIKEKEQVWGKYAVLHIRHAKYKVPTKQSGVHFQQVIKNKCESLSGKVGKEFRNLEKHLHVCRTEILGVTETMT